MAAHETNLKAVFTLVDQMSPVLQSMQREMRAAGRTMQEGFEQLADSARIAGAGIAALMGAGAGVWAATVSASETAMQLKSMSDQTGVAVERLQAWQSAATSAGMDGEEFAEALRDMNIELSDAATGGKEELANLLTKVGISARDASGNIKTADQVFLDFADAVAAQTDPAIQLRMAIAAFGEDAGAKLVPVLKQGSAAFRETEQAMKATGSALSEEEIERMRSFRNQWMALTKSLDTLRVATLGALAPAFGKITEQLQIVLSRIQPVINAHMEVWAQTLAAWIESIDWDSIISGIDALLTGGDRLEEEFGVLGTVINFLSGNLDVLLGSLVVFKAGMGALKIGQSFAQLGSGVLDFMKLMSPELFLALLGKWSAGITKFATTAWSALTFLGKAFLRAGPIGWILTALTVAGIVWDKWGEDIKKVLSEVWEAITDFFGSIGDWISEKIDGIVSAFDSLGNSLKEILPDWMVKLFADDSGSGQKISVESEEEGAGKNDEKGDGSYTTTTTTTTTTHARLYGRRFVSAGDAQTLDDAFALGPGVQSAFFQTRPTSGTSSFAQQVTQIQSPEMRGAVDVRFSNAPEGMRVEKTQSSGLTLNTNVDYEGSGRNYYAPSF